MSARQVLSLQLLLTLPAAAVAGPLPLPGQDVSETTAIPAVLRRPVTLHEPGNWTVGQGSSSRPLAQVQPQAGESASPENKQNESMDRSPEPESDQDDTQSLAKKAQNPIANLISVPFQNNTDFGAGPSGDGIPNVLNIQPVIPVQLNKELLLVTRTIVPIINQPAAATDQGSAFGLGDINPQFFFVPVSDGRITWGIGPAFVLPTATDDVLGQGKWSAGPTAVVVVTTESVVFGALANNVWSFAGDRDRESVNQFLLQPFLNYNLANGWYLVSSPIITSNWNAPKGEEQWTVPVGGGFGRVFAIGDQKVNATLQAYWNAVKPAATGDWTLRAQFQFLFPR